MIDKSHAKAYSNLLIQSSWMEKRKKELVITLESLKASIERDKNFTRGIEEKINELKSRDNEEDEDETKRILLKLKEQGRRVKSEIADTATAMAHFINTHYPAPDKAYDVASTPQSQVSDSDFVPLNVIVEKLTNTYIEEPHDCYVNIDKDWWPRHIEMLLRYGICVAHPQNPGKIRLEYYDS